MFTAVHVYKKSCRHESFRELFVDPATNEFHKPGSVIKPQALCETLRIIAEKNATEFYNGTIGRFLIHDLQEQGGIITMKDLNEYRYQIIIHCFIKRTGLSTYILRRI